MSFIELLDPTIIVSGYFVWIPPHLLLVLAIEVTLC